MDRQAFGQTGISVLCTVLHVCNVYWTDIATELSSILKQYSENDALYSPMLPCQSDFQ